MKCKMLLLPLLVGMAFCAHDVSAKKKPNVGLSHKKNGPVFIENKGQITDQNLLKRSDIDFKLTNIRGCNIFIGSGVIHYQWVTSADKKNNPDEVEMYRMDVMLVDANPDAPVVLRDQQDYYERYYTNGGDGQVAHSYGRLTYQNIYPNIDWTLYIKDKKVFKYDFIIHPGGRVSDIQLQYGGATTLALQQEGSLRATTPFGSIDEQAPRSFTQEGKVVGSRYLLKGDRLSFDVEPYNGTLIIDPEIQWGTYLGGLGNDQPGSIVADTSGNVYMSGGTLSIGNIATTGSYQYSYGGTGNGSYIMGDAFLTKFDANGNCLWSTYYGGSLEDRGLDIAFDKTSNSVYLAGSTKSTSGIATVGAHQQTAGGNFDAFLAKFDNTGSRLWATYYGGTAAEGNSFNTIGTTCDKAGNVFLCGETNSTTNIATTGCYQPTKAASSDAFVVKFNSNGTRQWATYLGGNGADKATKITSDSIGNIYLCGTTLSSSGLSTSGSYQNNYGGGNDGFLISLDSLGIMRWSSYLGGANYDDATAIKVGTNGKVYLSGTTYSTTGIATTGSFQDTLNGDGSLHNDIYLASFNFNGTPDWITYYGGENDETPSSIYYSPENSLYLNGYTQSAMGIATSNGLDTLLDNNSFDGFLAKFSNTGQRLWASYIGSTGYDLAAGLTGYQQTLFYSGMTNSSTGISTPGSYQENFGGGDNDAFLLSINLCDVPMVPSVILGDTSICSGHPYIYQVDTVVGATSYIWITPQSFSGSSTGNIISVVSGNQSGVLTVAALNACGSSDSTSINIIVHSSPQPVISKNGNTLTASGGFNNYQWFLNGQPLTGATNQSYIASQTGDYFVKVINSFGCDGNSDTVSTAVTGIHNLNDQHDLYWFPNPATGYLAIHADNIVSVFVYDMTGRLILSKYNPDRMDLSGLQDGTYMIRITDKNGETLKSGQFIKSSR